MGILDMLVEELNNGLSDEQKANGDKIERLHTEPVELVETAHGIRHRNVTTGQFTTTENKE